MEDQYVSSLCLGFLPATQKRKEPALVCMGQGGKAAKVPLSGNVSLEFSRTISCIGHYDGTIHHECPEMKTGVRQCRDCRREDIKNAYTFGDFSKYPQLYEKSLSTEFAIYLAQFGATVQKIGLARSGRALERLCEQGADYGCIIATFTGPEPAYAAEMAIAGRFGFRTAVSAKAKAQNLVFDAGFGRMNFSKAVEEIFSAGLPLDEKPPAIHEFGEYYPQMRKAPKKSDSISGEVAGTKGMLLFFSSPAGFFYMDMKDCIGRHFSSKKPEPKSQSSLFDF
ncbi:MAG: DUF2797 domain-containing protein [Candidatus Micrarchaeia archaeon]